MATDFNAEFKRIFGAGGCSVSGWNWNNPIPFDGTDKDSCYANEAALMSSLTSEAYNMYGFEIDYYIKQISTKRDRLLGEDPLENIVRRFRLSIYTPDIPNLQKQYQLQGMLYEEVFEVQATIAHFSEASQYDYNRTKIQYEIYKPKIGDIMYFKYCDKYYEVINVKEFKDGSAFLGTPITYNFTLRIWKNNHEDVDVMNQNDDKMPIADYTSLAESFDMEHKTSEVSASCDILSVNDYVKREDVGIQRYQPNDEPAYVCNQKRQSDPFDPFDGW